jgi:hypothetical protein
MSASAAASRERRTSPVTDRHIAPGVVAGVIRNSLSGPGDHRARLLRSVWIELKRFGASSVENVPLSRIRGIDDVRVDGPVVRHEALIVSALSALLECEKIFAFGAALSDTCALIAHNLPDVLIYALVPPEPQRLGAARSNPAPEKGITRLSGSVATFDLARYSGKNDLVLIDAGDAATAIRPETDAAFSLLSELGTIVWDNYTHSADAYAYLNALAPALDRPVFHILGTRLALYSRWDIVRPDDR